MGGKKFRTNKTPATNVVAGDESDQDLADFALEGGESTLRGLVRLLWSLATYGAVKGQAKVSHTSILRFTQGEPNQLIASAPFKTVMITTLQV